MQHINFTKFKNESYFQKLKELTAKQVQDKWYFVFFGGTGAVGGQSVIDLLLAFDFLYNVNPNWTLNYPTFVITGINKVEIDRFVTKLYNAFGRENRGEFVKLVDYKSSPSLVFTLKRKTGIILEFHTLNAVPNFKENLEELIKDKNIHECGSILFEKASQIESPFEEFLKGYLSSNRIFTKFKSVISGIPIPSVAAYHFGEIDRILEKSGLRKNDENKEIERKIKLQILKGIADDFGKIKKHLSEEMLIAHTTSVGGMYTIEDEKPVIRLGYAHSALDDALIEKQFYAEALTRMYSELNLKILITAAAIGIDYISINQSLAIQKKIKEKYSTCETNRLLPFKFDWLKDENENVFINRIFISTFTSYTYPIYNDKGEAETQKRVSFIPKEESKHFTPPKLKIKFGLRSGENGVFSIDNAYALYLNMKITTQEELGHILAFASLFGDDKQKPWFDKDGICYQTETDNSSLVFAFLNNRAEFREYQVSGFTPKAFQDLGSSKHQCELHTFGLYMLLHRLTNLNPKLIAEKITSKYRENEVIEFIDRNTDPLLIENIVNYNTNDISNKFARLLTLNSPEDLATLVGFNGVRTGFIHTFFQHLLNVVKQTVNTITSLGTPIVFNQKIDEKDIVKIITGPYCAPIETVITHNDTIAKYIKDDSQKYNLDITEYFNWLVANNGFIDLRPQATIITAKTHTNGLKGKVRVVNNIVDFKEVIARIQETYIRNKPHQYFATSGIIAFIGRITGLNEQLKAFDLSLGTLNNWRTLFPVDTNLNHPVIPGIIEAMRMYSEGLGKITGSEQLYPTFGYYKI